MLSYVSLMSDNRWGNVMKYRGKIFISVLVKLRYNGQEEKRGR